MPRVDSGGMSTFNTSVLFVVLDSLLCVFVGIGLRLLFVTCYTFIKLFHNKHTLPVVLYVFIRRVV